MSYQRLIHPEGEIGLARAAREAGIPLTLSMMSSCLLEEVAAVGGTLWFQLYLLRDRGQVADLIQRAEAAGCRALMLTVDVPTALPGVCEAVDGRCEVMLDSDVVARRAAGAFARRRRRAARAPRAVGPG